MMVNFAKVDVTIQSEYALSGTLRIPGGEGRHPAILMVAGSGPIDRHGHPQGHKTRLDMYVDLLDFFEGLGFVTLSYDKRGVGESKGEYLRAGMWDLVRDVTACIDFLKSHPQVDPARVIVVGHSEGSMLATVVAARTELAGIVLLAGANETLMEAMARQRQLAYAGLMGQKGIRGTLFRWLKIDEKGEKQARAVFDKMFKSKEDVIRVQFKPMNAKWFREHAAHDVKGDLARVTCPVLAATGDLDIQANPERLKTLNHPNITWKVIDHMNHVLRYEEVAPPILEMQKSFEVSAKMPIHPELKDLLAQWLGQFHN